MVDKNIGNYKKKKYFTMRIEGNKSIEIGNFNTADKTDEKIEARKDSVVRNANGYYQISNLVENKGQQIDYVVGNDIMNVNASNNQTTTNKNLQNNLKTLGFYNTMASIDGNLSSAESKRAITNFQMTYGLNQTGTMDLATSSMIYTATNYYNSVKNSAGVTNVARLVNGYSDYNESIVKSNVAKVWTFLRLGAGLNKAQAAGVMGNLMAESGCSPTNAQDGPLNIYKLDDSKTYSYKSNDGIGYGLAQWTAENRKKGLVEQSREMKAGIADINVQLAYIQKEAHSNRNGIWQMLGNSVESATKSFLQNYESPNVNAEEVQRRVNYAQLAYDSLA